MRAAGLLRMFDHSMGGRCRPSRRISDVSHKSVDELIPLLVLGQHKHSEWLTSQRSWRIVGDCDREFWGMNDLNRAAISEEMPELGCRMSDGCQSQEVQCYRPRGSLLRKVSGCEGL